MVHSASSSLVRILLKHAVDSGADTRPLLYAAGIDADALEDSEVRISAASVYALWKQAEMHRQDPNFGLHVGESMQGNPGGGLLFSLMMNSPTIGDALDKFCRYHHLMNDAIQPVLEVKTDMASLSWELKTPWPSSSRHIAEALLCIFQSILDHLTDRRFKPVEVRFRHNRPDDISAHQRIFRSSIRFAQSRDELVLKKRLLEETIYLADQRLLENLERYAIDLTNRINVQDSWTARVMQSINKNLQGKKPVITLIAKELAVSVRLLQNRLRGEKTSFQTILDGVRKETALHCLKNSETPLVDIAFILGFSEQSAFNHAFKRWTGNTPKQYRESTYH